MERLERASVDHYTVFMMENKYLNATNILGGLVATFSLVRLLLPEADEGLGLIPHHTIMSPVVQCPFPFCWNLITAHLYESNAIKAVLMLPTVVGLTKSLERLWSAPAVAFHVLFSCFAAGVSVFVIEVLRVYRTKRHQEFFEPVRGCCGLVVALAVGVRHAYPMEPVRFVPRIMNKQLKNQTLPFALMVIFILVGNLAPEDVLPEWPFAPLTYFFGWLHIRYFMWFHYAEAYGDHSVEFTFAGQFPSNMVPCVSFFGRLLHRVASKVFPLGLRNDNAGLGKAIVYDPTAAHDPERQSDVASKTTKSEYDIRRQKALAMLDDNLAELLAGGAPKECSILRGEDEPHEHWSKMTKDLVPSTDSALELEASAA